MGSYDTPTMKNATRSDGLRQPGVFGQMVFDSYTVVTLGFALDESQRDHVLRNLDDASIKLTAAFSFVAGQVVVENRTDTTSGLYKLVRYPPHEGQSLVRRNDCTSVLSSYSDIVSSKAPFSKIPGEILSPMPGFGGQMLTDIPWPVFVIQANFVSGGLLLTFASQHNALDMNGQAMLINHFSTAYNNLPFDPLDRKLGNEDPIQPFLHPGEIPIDLTFMQRPSQLLAPPPPPPPPHIWTYFRCPSPTLTHLKATSHAYSTNDALCAFYFHCISLAHLSIHTITPTESLHFGRATNARKPMGLTPKHMIHAVGHADTLLLPTDTLLSIAAALRHTQTTIDAHHIRSLITHIANTPDKTTISYGAMHRPDKDVIMSSWAHHPLYELEFGAKGTTGGLGKPDFCRRPNMDAVPGLAYMMPRTREGDIDVAVCLRPEELKALREVEEWSEVMEFIG